MNEAREYPKRIWAGHLGGGRRIWKPELMHESEKAFACQYVRADLADELLTAARTVLSGLNDRIDAADPRAVPVFAGIADLHTAIALVDEAQSKAAEK